MKKAKEINPVRDREGTQRASVSNGINLSDTLKKLAQIVAWFESQSELDVEKGLENMKEGAKLIKISRERLSEIENEFQEIRKEIQIKPAK